MTVTLRIGRPIDVEQGMIEATSEAATTTLPMGAVSTDTMMITTTVTIGAMTAMGIAVEAATVAAEEVYTSVV